MFLRSLIAGIAIAGLNLVAAQGAPATQPVDVAIVHLGDADPAIRDLAGRDLRSWGNGARGALQGAASGDNPEIAARCRAILRAAPIVVPPLAADDDEQEPSLIRYRASAPAAKRQNISFMAFTPGGVGALAKLWAIETDPELRAAIFQEMLGRPDAAGAALLATGNTASAQMLLQAAANKKIPGSQTSLAAYALCRGTIDDALRSWMSRGSAQPPDAWAEQVLATLYRAKGDAPAALRYAQAGEDRQLIRQTRFWAGDWSGIAADIRRDNPGAQALGDLSLLTSMDVLTGDGASLQLDLARLKNLAQTPPAVRTVSNLLLLSGRPDESAELCIASHDYGGAYEQLMVRGHFDQAARLLADHDADTSLAAAMLRCAAAKTLARCGDIPQATMLCRRIAGDKGASHVPSIEVALAEAEREAGLDELAWGHFADAIDAPDGRLAAFPAAAFPTRPDGVNWAGIWFAALTQNTNQNSPRTTRQIFDRVRRAYDRSMPIEELTAAIYSVDLTNNPQSPYIGLVWEAAERMMQAGNEAGGIKYAEQFAAQIQSGELYMDLGDHAALAGDWATAVLRYAAAWRKNPSQPLPLYLEGLALLRCGHYSEGQERIALAHLLPLGDTYLREQLLLGLTLRGFDDAAAAEASVIIRIGQPFTRPMDMAFRVAGERDADRGQCAVAAALFQRSMIDFMGGGFSFPEPAMNLFLASRAGRARARDLFARGNFEAAQEQIKACLNLMPGDIEVAIDVVPDLEKLGRKKEADALFADCFAIQQALCVRFPDSANQHNQTAWLAAKCNRELDRALEHARRAVDLAPKRTSYIDTLAEVYFMRGQYDQAIAEMKKCVAIEPMDWRHHRQIERFEAKKAGKSEKT